MYSNITMDKAHREIDLTEKMDELYIKYVAQNGNPMQQNDIEGKLAALQFKYHNLTGNSYDVRGQYEERR